MKVKPIKQKTVVEQLVSELREMIARGDFAPDDKFPTENELAERFGVSRTSVREAVKTLNYFGILESQTSRGTHISDKNRIAEEAVSWSVMLSYEKVYDVFVLGTALDTQVAIIILNKINKAKDSQKEFIEEMDSILREMKKYADENDVEQYEREFSRYFRVLYGASDNNVICSLNDCIEGLINKKVCEDYYKREILGEATQYLELIWSSIKEGSLLKTITAVQNYGSFAYEVFKTFEPTLQDSSYNMENDRYLNRMKLTL